MSPRRNAPSAPVMPPGSSEAPFSRIACAAPASMMIAPSASGACLNQCLRAASRLRAAWMRVPYRRSCASARTTSPLRPLNR
ncbi:hypothetical protein G6F46_015577 [Rhizopus delemar]|nr:hypothetical protein G6F46_015577 [Rhizopus delemar]